MSLYNAHLQYEEKGDARNRGVSHIRSPCPKILGPALSLTTLSNFLKLQSALALLSPEPPPPAVLDLGPRAYRCLIPGLGVHHHQPQARRPLSLSLEYAVVDLKHAAAIIDLKPVVIDLATVIVDLGPTSLGLGLCLVVPSF
jgi:hypothetical protein